MIVNNPDKTMLVVNPKHITVKDLFEADNERAYVDLLIKGNELNLTSILIDLILQDAIEKHLVELKDEKYIYDPLPY